MNERVEITDVALAEAEEAYLWMCDRDRANAGRWFEGLMEAINSKDKSLKRRSLASERDAFTVCEQAVYILHVRHAARQLLEP